MIFVAVVFWWLIVMCIPSSYRDSGIIILFLYVLFLYVRWSRHRIAAFIPFIVPVVVLYQNLAQTRWTRCADN